MLDFICMGFAELWGAGKELKIQNENIWLKQFSTSSERLPSTLDNSVTPTYKLNF